jgi:hypothetical protein
LIERRQSTRTNVIRALVVVPRDFYSHASRVAAQAAAASNLQV